MIHWYNSFTRECWHTILENWDDLDQLAQKFQGDPVSLACSIRDSFFKAFELAPCPFLRLVGILGIRHVNFRQIADSLLAMVDRQRQHQNHGGPKP